MGAPPNRRVLTSADALLDPLYERTVAVLGFGAQGHAHAQALRESGVRVVVAQRPGPRHDDALEAGFLPISIAEAVAAADLLIFGLPDEAAPAIYEREIRPLLRAGQCLGFIHGYAIHYQTIRPAADVDVVLVAPKAQGHALLAEYLANRGVFALFAVHQDATGHAREIALAWAAGIGAGRVGILETTFRDETETDLFGEQAVLCGGLTALIKAGFDTLVEAGYPPELAYFECCHEVKIISDLVHERGIPGMRERISGTARFGDVTRGPRVVDERVRETMRQILTEIRDGRFANEWGAEAAAGYPQLRALVEKDSADLLEKVGARLRGRRAGE